jgi:indole-3-glycerol phosphate synthase
MILNRAASGADLLETIVAATRRVVAVRQEREPIAALARRAEERPQGGKRFRTALERKDRINVIAECKRRSPSRGVLRPDYDAVAVARGYAAAGAAAVSVLTEPTFFDGSLDDLARVRAAVEVPILRKDFIVSDYQLYEAKAAGADAVLLIVAALSTADLRSLSERAALLGLDVLVEVHDAGELAAARDAGSTLIGVNNRSLRTLAVDVHASEELIDGMPPGAVAVSESGLKTPGDLIRLRALGYSAFLIGERFMTGADPGGALRGLLGAIPETAAANDAEARRSCS